MATELDYDLLDQPVQTKYPWNVWTNGSTWEITAGEDFQPTLKSMTVILYQQAKKRGLKCTLRTSKRRGVAKIVFRFFKPEPEVTE